jgi:hypothetical protein
MEMNLSIIILGEKSQFQKVPCWMIPFMWHLRNGQFRDKVDKWLPTTSWRGYFHYKEVTSRGLEDETFESLMVGLVIHLSDLEVHQRNVYLT